MLNAALILAQIAFHLHVLNFQPVGNFAKVENGLRPFALKSRHFVGEMTRTTLRTAH